MLEYVRGYIWPYSQLSVPYLPRKYTVRIRSNLARENIPSMPNLKTFDGF